ncbi:MAG: subclass B1 metallo-beta-lactamase [Bacteroidetes bacterium]|nr:subclass B1 metallo-beta-lactamase [Bacteroidota bacterium]
MLFQKNWLSFNLFIVFTLSSNCLVLAQDTINKLKISPLNDRCYVFTTWQKFNGQDFPANGMYVVASSGVIMIDTPWDTTQVAPLLDSIFARHHKKVVLCIATHYHDDRTGGFQILDRYKIKTWSSALTNFYCDKNKTTTASAIFLNDTIFNIDDVLLETYYPGPGHTSDNIVIWLPKQKILYGGCLIKSTDAQSLGNLTDADIYSWSTSLNNVRKKYPKPDFIIPGHQNWHSTFSIQHTLKLLEVHNNR